MTAKRRGKGKVAEEGERKGGGGKEGVRGRRREGGRTKERESGQMAGERGGSFTNSHTSLVESGTGAALLLQSPQELT